MVNVRKGGARELSAVRGGRTPRGVEDGARAPRALSGIGVCLVLALLGACEDNSSEGDAGSPSLDASVADVEAGGTDLGGDAREAAPDADDATADATDGGRTDAPMDAQRADTATDLPTADLPTADLPTADLPTADLPADVGGGLPAPRPVSPLTGTHTGARRPTLRWTLSPGADGARVLLCRDRALTIGCVMFDAPGTSGMPPSDLARGGWYWGLRGLRGGVPGASTSAAWRITVGSAATSGRAWGGDPDINGDGLADVVASDGTSTLLVYLGTPSGLSAVTTIAAPFDATQFGAALEFVGDVDGDGYGDVAVGAPGSDTAYFYRGSATGLVTPPVTLNGPHGSRFGASIAGASDCNGDGYADLVIAMPDMGVGYFSGGPGGPGMPVRITPSRRYVHAAGDVNGDGRSDVLLDNTLVFGSAAGLDIAGARTEHYRGAVGDIDGDGYADVVVEPPGSRPMLSSGGPGFPSRLTAIMGQNDFLSDRPGDLNGDGFDDLISSDDGVLRVIPGSATGADSPAVEVPTSFGGPSSRRPVVAGDIDGDGFGDLLSGGPDVLFANRGSAAGIVSHATLIAGIGPLWFYWPARAAAAGDVNGDGHADVLAYNSSFGRIDLILGNSTGFASTSATSIMSVPDWPGGDAPPVEGHGIGDVNHDGFEDVSIAVGREVRLYLGSATGLAATYTPFPGGASIAAGDINGDGRADVVTPSASAVYFGSAAGIDPTPIPVTFRTALWVVGAAGDVNHDGFGDLLVREAEGATRFVLAGSPSGLRATPLASLTVSGPLVAPGDINCDGYADLVVGAGRAIAVYNGNASGLSGPTMFAADGQPMPVGDINRDGCADLLVLGSPSAMIYRGSPSGLVPRAELAAAGPSEYGGMFVFAAPLDLRGFGDVDGDGTSDLVSIGQGSGDPLPATFHPTGRRAPSAGFAVSPTGVTHAFTTFR